MMLRRKRPMIVSILMIVVMLNVGHQVYAASKRENSAVDAVYIFMEEAFPMLRDTGVRKEMAKKEEPVFVEYDIPVAVVEEFKGYPDGEIVKEVVQPRALQDIKPLYNESVIQNFNMLQNLYSYDVGDVIRTPEDLNGEKFMQYDFKTDLEGEEPVILLFHTHGTEGYIDHEKYGVIEAAAYLKEILEEKYGISVLHHKEIYDADGVSGAYERVNESVSKIIAENPSIQVAIDIHRDGIGGDGRLAATVNGKETAQVMLVNGLCKVLDQNGVMQTAYIAQNPYLEENLAFSFRMKMASDAMYEGWMRNMYLKAYRYSTHMLPKSLLLEVGAEGNTLQEAKNAMEPMAEVLVTVLTGNG